MNPNFLDQESCKKSIFLHSKQLIAPLVEACCPSYRIFGGAHVQPVGDPVENIESRNMGEINGG